MNTFSARRKFQPNITPLNSRKRSELPTSILDMCTAYFTLKEIEEDIFNKGETFTYVLEDRSTEQELIPMRDKGQRFLILIL